MEPNPRNDIRLTTKSLGIADSKEEDLGGYVLSQKDIISATTKILMAVGINDDDIRVIKVGSDAKRNLRIICEIKYKAAFKDSQNSERTQWYSFTDGTDDDQDSFKNAFSKNFYAALYNKVYHGKKKHLGMKIVKRPDPSDPGRTKKYISFEFDPYILIAFVYDIVFTDPYYKISAAQTRWRSGRDLENMTGKQKKRYLANKREYENDGLSNCVVYVTFKKNSTYKLKRDDNVTEITGFHPAQVDDFYGD